MQGRAAVTLFGPIRLTRAYCYCRACCTGHCPRDAALGLTHGTLTRGAAEVVALAGTLGSFAEASTKTLSKLCGLRVGESTVERTTERAEADGGARRAAGKTFGTAKAWT